MSPIQNRTRLSAILYQSDSCLASSQLNTQASAAPLKSIWLSIMNPNEPVPPVIVKAGPQKLTCCQEVPESFLDIEEIAIASSRVFCRC
jgi:hypothetical protein